MCYSGSKCRDCYMQHVVYITKNLQSRPEWSVGVCNRGYRYLGDDSYVSAKSSLVVRQELQGDEAVAERRMIDRMNTIILNNPSHLLDDELWQMDSPFSHQLIPPKIKTVRFRRSVVPTPIRRHNSICDQSLSQLTPKPLPLYQTCHIDCSHF